MRSSVKVKGLIGLGIQPKSGGTMVVEFPSRFRLVSVLPWVRLSSVMLGFVRCMQQMNSGRECGMLAMQRGLMDELVNCFGRGHRICRKNCQSQ